jgi:two-component system probable response regulator PhcQ
MLSASHRSSVLLVDDETHVTDALSRHFPKESYEVLKAISAADAYRLLAERQIDVIVSDERMPGESGSEFLAKVRRRYPNTIRMILSGQASLEAAIRAINDGEVYRFFLKPCNPIDLLFTIQRALEHRRLAEQGRALLKAYQQQSGLLAAVQQGQSPLLDLQLDDSGAVLIEEFGAADSVESLLQEIEASMVQSRARQKALLGAADPDCILSATNARG